MEAILILGAVLALIGTGVVVAYWMDAKRRDALMEVADKLGLQFHAKAQDLNLGNAEHFKFFNTGRVKKRSKAIVAESEGTSIAIFDYSYTVGSGKNSRTYSQTVAVIQSAELQIPDFSLRNEGLFDRLGGLVGMQDIDFATHPKFSKQFVLKGGNESAIRKLFRPQLLEFFETHKGISVEAAYGAFVYYSPSKKIKPHDIKHFMSTAYEIYGQLIDASAEVLSPKA